MSNELRVNYAGAGATLYVIARRIVDNYVYSTVTTAFAAWSDGSIANYDIALTDQGGDLYTADMPAAILAGDYRFEYYERAGATPAITDLLLLSEELHWDGAATSSVSSITLSSYALTTLADQKRFMRITDSDDDTLLTQLINAVSVEIERVCGVQFVARDRRERLNGAGQKRLVLKNWPVLFINRLGWGNGPAITVTYTGSGVRAEVGVTETSVRIQSFSSTGAATTNTFLFADYPALSTLRTAIVAVSGWSATVNQNMPTADLNPQGGTDAKSRSVILGYPDRADIEYRLDYSAGLVELNGIAPGWGGGALRPLYGRETGYEALSVFPCGHQYIFVHYRSGFETVPADVELICNRLVQDEFVQSESGSSFLASATLGPFSWRANAHQVREIRDELAYYIDISRSIGGV